MISPRALTPFVGEWYLETKLQVPGMLIAARESDYPGIQTSVFTSCVPVLSYYIYLIFLYISRTMN